jgi:hypothetical protein
MANVKTKLQDLEYEVIQAHMLDPENNPLPEDVKNQFDRVLAAAKMLDDYPDDNMIVQKLKYRYNASVWTLRRSVDLAKRLYKTKHTFDWDFWHIWQIRDQLELIHKCKEQGNLKEWNNAKKVLQKIIGEKPEGLEDPNRMGKNQFFIQVNIDGENQFKPLPEVQDLKPNEVKEIIELMQQPIDEAQAAEIMDA